MEPARSRYRHGIFSWFGYRLSLSERMSMIKGAGYDATSVWLGRTERMVREGDQDRIPEVVRSFGLELEYIHASYTNCNKLWSDDAADRDIIRADYVRDIAYCGRHGIPALVVHISKGLNPRPPSERGVAVIAELVREAESAHTTLVVENTRQPGHIDYILSRIDSPSLRFCYDSSHDFLLGGSIAALLARWGSRLAVTHLSDNDGLSDKHWLPGDGTGAWDRVARAFPAATFNGFLTLEVLPSHAQYLSSREFLREGRRRLSWFESLLP